MKICVPASTNTVGSRQETEIDIPDSEWEAMSADEQETLCFETALQLIEWNWHVK